MPLMSPARTPGASSFRSVLSPSMKKLPSRMRLSGGHAQVLDEWLERGPRVRAHHLARAWDVLDLTA